MGGFGERPGTPLYRLPRVDPTGRLWLKSEHLLPSGSIFDRIAGPLLEGGTAPALIAGGGSAALAFSAAAARAGRALTCVVPSQTLPEHRTLLRSSGVELIDADGPRLLDASVTAERLAEERGVELLYGPKHHAASESAFATFFVPEFVAQIETAGLDAPTVVFPSGVFGLRAALSQVFQGRIVETHAPASGMQDGALSLDASVMVADARAYEARRSVAASDGVLLGWASSGALAWALDALELEPSQSVVVVSMDAGDRYFSRDLAFRSSEESHGSQHSDPHTASALHGR